MNNVLARFIIFFSIGVSAQPGFAGGFLGDIVEGICGGCGLGTAFDKGHDKLGNPLDVPGRIRREAAVEVLGPALGEAIRHSRNDARAAGTHPIPDWIKFQMSPFFDQDILNRVQYRIGGGGDLSVQANAIRYGEANGVALIDTIVFDTERSSSNLTLWSHELYHIIQFRLWGRSDFGKRYVRSSATVEADANRMEQKFDRLHPYIIGRAPTHADGVLDGNWVYLGHYNGSWKTRNFQWSENQEFLPLLGSTIVAKTDVNMRQNHITYDQAQDRWTNAAAVRVVRTGESFRIVRLHDVTNGERYMWALVE
ncbi:MAG: DUF4157 domain-containing protein [Rhizobiales bacterium]|nr:DUF4157 domain-containing protein [Hyphomicrobiales bacterium]